MMGLPLWPDAREDEALANLRRHLHALARALPPLGGDPHWFHAARLSVRWTADPMFADVTAFERALSTDDAQQAVALYGGALCPAIDEDWADVARSRYAGLAIDVLDRLVERDRFDDTRRAITWAVRARDLDPWRESNVRTLIELYGIAGDGASARRLYRDFAQALDREFGALPDAETTALYERIAMNQGRDVPSGAGPRRASAAGVARVSAGSSGGGERSVLLAPSDACSDSPVTREPPATAISLRAHRQRHVSSKFGADRSRAKLFASCAPDAPSNNLPIQTSSFIGRQREVAELCEMVLGYRMVTLVGSGGIGKTRTSLQIAGKLVEDFNTAFG